LLVVVRGFYITLGVNYVRFWSDQIDLPIPPVNNYDFRVWYALNSPMDTLQGEYDFEFNPGGVFRFGVKATGQNGKGIILNNSFMFIVQYS
jgi:hypothetical protein